MSEGATYGIRVWAFAGSALVPRPGEWLEHFDFDACAPGRDYPTGNGDTTTDATQAMGFASAAEAWEFWRRPSERTPLRPDGQPNRPMTALTVSIEPLPEGSS